MLTWMKIAASPERGMAVIAVIVLITVLFLSGTVMALAVSSNLRTVDILGAKDAVHYAAESGVARGAAALLKTNPCSVVGSPTINGRVVSIWCSGEPTDEDTPDEDSTKPSTASIPSRQLTPGVCTSTKLPPSNPKMTVWSVIGWRGSGGIVEWTDGNQLACSPSGVTCNQRSVFTNVVYVRCQPKTTDSFLHFAGTGGPVVLGTSVVRWVPISDHSVRTVVGTAGFEVDEADVVLGNGVALWNTVLP
jgi:hypothetical protein